MKSAYLQNVRHRQCDSQCRLQHQVIIYATWIYYCLSLNLLMVEMLLTTCGVDLFYASEEAPLIDNVASRRVVQWNMSIGRHFGATTLT